MSEIEFTSTMTVELVDSMGDDLSVARAARVSTLGDTVEHSQASNAGLIGYLMKNRHGSPFEHTSMTFRIEAPIFVFREFMRHRIGWSYNESSARYSVIPPKFYVYPAERPIVQEGVSAHPKLVAGTEDQQAIVQDCTGYAYSVALYQYHYMLEAGIANEVARAALPVGTYSTMYATCNARSLMSFLSLRVDDEANTFETKPQWEIEQVALQMETIFATFYPHTHNAYVTNGRVAP